VFVLKKKAIAYYRKSIERDAAKSIQGQKDEVQQYAEENNIEIVMEFEEVASSATLKRDAFQKMFGVLSARSDIDYILVHRFDRITREMDHFGWIISQLKEILDVKTRLHSVTEDNDYDDDPYKLLLRVMQTFGSTQERINVVERLQGARQRKAAKGGFIGGTPPVGYVSIVGTGKLAINETEVLLVKTVFELKEQGLSMNKIAAKLNEMGFTSRKGLKFHAQTVQRILKHERLYKGEYDDPGILVERKSS
jgi:site-specific DNA recombinase